MTTRLSFAALALLGSALSAQGIGCSSSTVPSDPSAAGTPPSENGASPGENADDPTPPANGVDITASVSCSNHAKIQCPLEFRACQQDPTCKACMTTGLNGASCRLNKLADKLVRCEVSFCTVDCGNYVARVPGQKP